jgi:nicotinamide-nucleotide amidase
MFPANILHIAGQVLAGCKRRSLLLATAESCTGGLIAAALTEIAGASDVVERGFVTYSNEAKQSMLGVKEALLARHGAVSREVAMAMAEGALTHSCADISVAVTGIAGPGGGTAGKPVGMVHIATARRGQQTVCRLHQWSGTRSDIRLSAVHAALTMLLEQL